MMSRGKKWDPSVDELLREKYPDTRNEDLANETGYGIRTLERHARMLGLNKSAEFVSDMQRKASIEGVRWFEYMRITGQKVKKKAVGGKQWEKGHRFEGEIEEKRVKALRDRVWDERRRMMHGMKRRTKWRMVEFGKLEEKS